MTHAGRNIQPHQSTVTRSVEINFRKIHQPSKHTQEMELEICFDVVKHKKTSIQDIFEKLRKQTNVFKNILTF